LYINKNNILDILLRYFPNLSPQQITQFDALFGLYEDWNQKINVISRKDIEHLYERHILHSLAIAKVMPFKENAAVLDLGTGGGFPGIPLAILFPETQFLLVDSIGKKILVATEVAQSLGLKNVKAVQTRVEEIKGQKFDFIVSRAVAALPDLLRWSRKLLKTQHTHAYPNGWFLLKGGNLDAEIKPLMKQEYIEKHAIQQFFRESFFEEKFVIYVQG
jgi:16S rRNA (guanine527-N7)-methyltransferase